MIVCIFGIETGAGRSSQSRDLGSPTNPLLIDSTALCFIPEVTCGRACKELGKIFLPRDLVHLALKLPNIIIGEI